MNANSHQEIPIRNTKWDKIAHFRKNKENNMYTDLSTTPPLYQVFELKKN